MAIFKRRMTLALRPSKLAHDALDGLRLRHQQLYNAALEERIGSYKKGVQITFYDQARSLTEIRKDDPDFRAMTQGTQNATLRRLDRAFQSFFRRIKAGQTPGFPRFKSRLRYSGWNHPRDGYKYKPKQTADGRWFNGILWIAGVGAIKARGKARWRGGVVKQVDISKRAGRWYASLAIECEVERNGGTRACGLDWGVTDFATLAYADGTIATIPNDRLFRAQQEKAAEAQRKASKSLRGKRSNRAKAAHLRIARAHGRVANQRKDRAHKLSAKLVAEHALIATEEMKIANMTCSAKGTVEKPGKMVAQKAGLNREILDTAPGMFFQMLKYKAEEAGTILELINTRKVKPSQTCPGCGARAKKTLAQRVHACGCGLTMSRDGAAALVMLQASEEFSGRKPAPEATPETPPRIASAI